MSDRRATKQLLQAALDGPAPRGFLASIDETGDALAVIAEIKRHSPSVGPLDHALSPGDLGRKYQGGGAACLSVLTERQRFHGSIEDLQAARDNVDIPVLRKDFISTEKEVYRSRVIGADAILLIMADLSIDQLIELREAADLVNLDVLVEVHDVDQLVAALAADPDAIGVNQRNLATMELDPTVHERVIRMIPEEITAVAESGIKGPREAQRLVDLGYDAILVGSHLVTSENPLEAVYDLRRKPSR